MLLLCVSAVFLCFAVHIFEALVLAGWFWLPGWRGRLLWRPALRLAAARLGPLSVPATRLVAVAVGGRRRWRALVAFVPAGLLAALRGSLDAAGPREATGRDIRADCLRGVGSNTEACVLQAVQMSTRGKRSCSHCSVCVRARDMLLLQRQKSLGRFTHPCLV